MILMPSITECDGSDGLGVHADAISFNISKGSALTAISAQSAPVESKQPFHRSLLKKLNSRGHWAARQIFKCTQKIALSGQAPTYLQPLAALSECF